MFCFTSLDGGCLSSSDLLLLLLNLGLDLLLLDGDLVLLLLVGGLDQPLDLDSDSLFRFFFRFRLQHFSRSLLKNHNPMNTISASEKTIMSNSVVNS